MTVNSGILSRRILVTLIPLGLFLMILMFQQYPSANIFTNLIEKESIVENISKIEAITESDNTISRNPVFYAIYDTHTPKSKFCMMKIQYLAS